MAEAGEIWSDVSWEGLTKMVAFPLIEPNWAVMVALPIAFAVTRPPPLTAATVESDEVHLAIFVIT